MPRPWDPRQPANFKRGAAFEFVEALKAAPPGSRGVVFDVGANNGAWSASWQPHIESFRTANKTLDLILFEPQAGFAVSLQALARRLHGTFVQAAAWRSDSTLRLRRDGGSVSATVHAIDTVGSSDDGGSLPAAQATMSTVRAVDLAAYVMRTLPRIGAARELSLMKLDVEGAGVHLLAALFASRDAL